MMQSNYESKSNDINMQVVKIGNIPWEISSLDICSMIQPYLWRQQATQEWVHIPIDRVTGKTKSDLFVEVPTMFEAQTICERLNNMIVKQRAIQTTISSYEELAANHFTNRQGKYLTKDEVYSLVDICRNFKVHFSRKCAERPFEHVLSLLRLIPWYRLDYEQVDLLFDLLRLSVEALVLHRSRPSCQMEESLLPRMIQAGLYYPAFSSNQKEVLQKSACLITSWKFAPKFKPVRLADNDISSAQERTPNTTNQ